MKKTIHKTKKPAAGEGSSLVIREVSEEEFIASAQKRKAQEGYFDFDEIGSFTYPTFFTAAFEYGATGEGMTFGVTMSRASSAAQLRASIDDAFGSYFGSGVYIWPVLVIPAKFDGLIPMTIRKVIEECAKGRSPPHLKYTSVYHFNMS